MDETGSRQELMGSFGRGAPPAWLTPALKALWFAEQGDLDRAFQVVTDAVTEDAAWVQAHLHRATGDLARARFWYARAGKTVPVLPVDQERQSITKLLLVSG